MPLSPLPASNTRRYFVVYTAGGLEHRLQVRSTEAITDAQAIAGISARLSELLPVMYADTSFLGLERADLGSDIRNPVSGWSVLTGTQPGVMPALEKAYTLSARGRTTGGRKTKLLLFGVFNTRQADWEFTPAPATDFETFLTGLNATVNLFTGIDGLHPIWKNNFLQDYNDHWEHELRP